ncbi:MAG: serine hydrolase [Gemmatimonadaceae bacterium]
MHHLRFFVLCSLTLIAADPHPIAAQQNVDDFIRDQMRELRIPGLSIAVIKEGKIVKEAGYGLADVETNTPATPQTVYKAASLSKQFIGAAIMLLVQDGKLQLDDRASRFLDTVPDTWKDITIRELLTHTSGIVRDPVDYEPFRAQPITDVVRSAYSLPLNSQPGEKWLYSNVGYYVLAQIISNASGKPWDQFIAERLFVPAGMVSTRTTTTTAIVPNRASGYTRDGETIVDAENWIAVRPSGAFVSTVDDLARWDAFLDTTSALSPSSRQQLWTRVKLKDQTSEDYGFGWYVHSFLGRARIHHDGQFPGFRSDYERFPDDKLTVIILANSDKAGLESFALKLAGFYAPSLVAPPFVLTGDPRAVTGSTGNAIPIRFTAKDAGKAVPGSVIEIEVWDASDKSVYKDHQANENFAAGETKPYTFSWTPTKPGSYTVTLSAYGPRWTPPYAFKSKAIAITVN